MCLYALCAQVQCTCVCRDMVIAAPGTPCESVFLTLAMSPIPIGWSGGGWWDEGGKWQDKRSKCLLSCLHTHTNTLTTCLAVGLFVDAKGRDPLSKHRCWSWSSPVDVSIQTHTDIHATCVILFGIRIRIRDSLVISTRDRDLQGETLVEW